MSPGARGASPGRAIVAALVAIVVLGLVIWRAPLRRLKVLAAHTAVSWETDPAVAEQALLPKAREQSELWEELDARFNQGVVMLHARQFDYALVAFERVLAIDPKMADAHVNKGFALLGLERWADAAAAFDLALHVRPEQVNAYYGRALAAEALGDIELAVGHLRTYVHLTGPDDPHLITARERLGVLQATLEAARAADPAQAPGNSGPAGPTTEGQ